MPRRLNPIRALGLLALLIAAAFGGVLANGFVFDDREIVQNNPAIETLAPADHLGEGFWSRPGLHYRYYRPLTTWTLALNHAIHGESSTGYHLLNLLVHFGSAALLFLILRRLGGSVTGFIAAALFAVHPIQSEAVAWVVGRADLLATLFVLATLLLHARLPERPSARHLARLAPALLTLAAALLSKEAALTFPALLIGYELALALTREGSVRDRLRAVLRRLVLTAPLYLAVIVGYLVLRHQVVGALLATPDETLWKNPLLEAPLVTRWFTAVNIAGRYLLLVVFPRTLSIDYYFDVVPLVRSGLTTAFLLPGLAIAAVTALCVATARRLPAVLFGALAALGTYLPLSHVLFAAPVVMAERALYLPMIGVASALAALLVAAFARLTARHRPTAGLVVVLVLVLLAPLVLRSRARVHDWKDDLTLFTAAVKAQPRSALSWSNLASLQLQVDDPVAAETSARQALEIVPDYLAARGNLADALRRQGRLDETERVLRQALRDSPHAAEALWLSLTQLITMRAARLETEGNNDTAGLLRAEAIRQSLDRLQRVEAGRPRAVYQLVLAQNLWALDRNTEAGEAFRAALDATQESGRVEPALIDVRVTILDATAAWQRQQGRDEPAALTWIAASSAAETSGDPSRAAGFLLRAAQVRSGMGQRDQALALVQQAQRLGRNDPVVSRQVRSALAALQPSTE